VQRGVAAPQLGDEDIVDDAGGVEDFRERALIAGRKRGGVGAQFRGGEAGDHAIEFGEIGGAAVARVIRNSAGRSRRMLTPV